VLRLSRARYPARVIGTSEASFIRAIFTPVSCYERTGRPSRKCSPQLFRLRMGLLARQKFLLQNWRLSVKYRRLLFHPPARFPSQVPSHRRSFTSTRPWPFIGPEYSCLEHFRRAVYGKSQSLHPLERQRLRVRGQLRLRLSRFCAGCFFLRGGQPRQQRLPLLSEKRHAVLTGRSRFPAKTAIRLRVGAPSVRFQSSTTTRPSIPFAACTRR
jgi:hypothetical protein